MANELREYLDSLGLKDEAIEKAVELATPDSFRSDLAALGGKNKEYETELKELRPLKHRDARTEALEPFGFDYDKSPKYLKDVFDKLDPEKLGDKDYVSQHLRDNDVEVKAPETQTPTGDAPKAAAIVNHAVNSTGTPGQETYEQAIAAATSPDELDAVYQRFGKEPVSS